MLECNSGQRQDCVKILRPFTNIGDGYTDNERTTIPTKKMLILDARGEVMNKMLLVLQIVLAMHHHDDYKSAHNYQRRRTSSRLCNNFPTFPDTLEISF